MSETNTNADGVTITSQPPPPEAPPESTPAPAEATEQTEEEGATPRSRHRGPPCRPGPRQAGGRRAGAGRAARRGGVLSATRATSGAGGRDAGATLPAGARRRSRQEVEAQIRTETFHQQGATQYGDWKQRCDDLVAMGADAGFAQLLVEMPGGEGVRVAAALAADPDAVERIANLRTERARAVALGKYAATIEDATHDRSRPNGVNGAAAAPAVTRAPAPVRPVTGRASPQFNEYTATAQQLADFYMRQTLEKQTRR